MLMCAGEDVDAGHLGHVVVDDEQRHRLVLVGQLPQHRQSGGGRRLTDDPKVCAEPPAEIVSEGVHHPGIVIDHEQDGAGHPLPFTLTSLFRGESNGPDPLRRGPHR